VARGAPATVQRRLAQVKLVIDEDCRVDAWTRHPAEAYLKPDHSDALTYQFIVCDHPWQRHLALQVDRGQITGAAPARAPVRDLSVYSRGWGGVGVLPAVLGGVGPWAGCAGRTARADFQYRRGPGTGQAAGRLKKTRFDSGRSGLPKGGSFGLKGGPPGPDR